MQTDAPSFSDVLRIRTFRVLYAAEVQSIFGDQLARIALSLLVFAQTRSDAATGLTYGLTFLPAIVGGFALARVGDRWPRRAVMITCDVFRALAFLVMAIPGLSLYVVSGALVLAVFVGPAFSASSISYLASKLSDQEFRTASGLRMSTNQASQVAGFAVGGLLSGVLGVRETLVLNSLTYAVSAAIIASLRWSRRGRHSAGRHASGALEAGTAVELDNDDDHTRVVPPDVELGSGAIASMLRDPRTRVMVLLSALAGFFVVPESLAVPYAAQLGVGSTSTGVLIAMIPLGSAVGVVVLTRIIPSLGHPDPVRAMAISTGVPLALPLVFPSYGFACVCWFASGFAAAYEVEALIRIVRSVPDKRRSQVASVLSSLLLGAQGIGPLVFSAFASVTSPAGSIAAAGLVGSVFALATAVIDRRDARLRRRPNDAV